MTEMQAAGAAETAPSESPSLDVSALLYCARSGSTFFAYRLAEASARLAVIPEFRLPLLLLWLPEEKVRALTGATLLELMRDDVQIGNLEIPADALPALAERLAGGSTRAVLEGVLNAHLAGAGLADRRAVLLKNSEFALNGPRLAEVFPEIRALHVRRDPRGVANSMVSSPLSYDEGRPMAHGNVVYAAKIWTRYMARCDALAWPVLEIPYERAVADPDAEARAAVAWLLGEDAPGAEAAEAAESGFKVGAAEQGIHTLAAGAAAPQRKEAWRTELPPWQVAAVEAVAGEAMAARGYAFAHPAPDGGAPALSLRGKLWNLRKEGAHYAGSALRLIAWIVKDRRRARVRLRQFIARQLGRN